MKQPTLHRSNHPRSPKARPPGWLPVLLWIGLLLIALIFLLNPFPAFIPDDPLIGVSGSPGERLLHQLAYTGFGQIVGSGLLVGAAIGGWFRLREKINGRSAYWSGTCPNCQGNTLSRIRRRATDRLICKLGIPVRRFRCDTCRWKGLRIEREHL